MSIVMYNKKGQPGFVTGARIEQRLAEGWTLSKPNHPDLTGSASPEETQATSNPKTSEGKPKRKLKMFPDPSDSD